MPEKVNPGGNVTVSGTSDAPPFSSVNVKIPAIGNTWISLTDMFGAYSLNNTVFDIYMTIPFAILGYVCVKLTCEPAPLLLGFVLGKLMEEYLRRAMTISRGDPMVFITRPLSATMLAIAAVLLIIVFLPSIARFGCVPSFTGTVGASLAQRSVKVIGTPGRQRIWRTPSRSRGP